MKNFEVSAYGVDELQHDEMQQVDGGWAWLAALVSGPVAGAIALTGAAIYVYNNWDDFAAGVKEGYEREMAK